MGARVFQPVSRTGMSVLPFLGRNAGYAAPKPRRGGFTLALLVPRNLVRNILRAICYNMVHDKHTHDSGTAGDGRRRGLNRKWRRDMGIAPKSARITALGLDESLYSAGWAGAEFGSAELGHKGATARLVHIAEAKARDPSAPYTECCGGDRHDLKASYRFINREHGLMTPAGILSGHRRQTVRRIKGCRLVLAVQDTAMLDFSGRHCDRWVVAISEVAPRPAVCCWSRALQKPLRSLRLLFPQPC